MKRRKKRTKREKREKIQAILERRRRFDYDYIPFLGEWSSPDGNFRYRLRGWGKFCELFLRTAMFLFGWLLIGFAFGARVTGRKNLRAIKKSGAIGVCNHFHYLDTLCVRQAFGHFRSYHTMGPKNNKRGLGGAIIRHGGMLTFSSDRNAMRHLNAEIARLLGKGKIVNFYAEQAMWGNYQKPRPMKDGAFHYAVKHNVPVVPLFCTFRKSKRGHIRRLRIRILPAVYGDETLPHRARAEAMRECAEKEWKDCYERAYGKPLVYLEEKPQTL